jgi:hypothetical protein
MRRGKKLVLLGLGGCFALIGCVGVGRPIDSVRGRSPSDTVARGPDIPLVPLPPLPLGKVETPEITPVAVETPSVPPAPPLKPVPPAATPPTSSVPSSSSPPPPPSAPAVTVRQLYQTARTRFATVDSYIVRLTRREQVKDKLNPEEVILFKFRKEPWSVHLKWLGKEGQGREVVYVKGRYEGKLHTLLAAGDVFLMPAGKRMALSPDNLLVRSACRHPITEAGIGASIDRIGSILAGVERGDPRMGRLTVLAGVKRPEFDQAVAAIEHDLPPGLDPSLPKGGRRTWFFDPELKLPMLIAATDERGREVEYYRYDRLQYPVNLQDSDFDPDLLWGKPGVSGGR